jgi:hypothetical protein
MTLEGNSERCVAENYRLCATPTIREPEHTCGGCGEGARGVREGAEAHL